VFLGAFMWKKISRQGAKRMHVDKIEKPEREGAKKFSRSI
jgi:hypothetical protein